MELWQELLYHMVKNETLEIHFPQAEKLHEVLESKCYQILQEIKTVLEDDTLNDQECFIKIEKMIRIFENADSRITSRHDFG